RATVEQVEAELVGCLERDGEVAEHGLSEVQRAEGAAAEGGVPERAPGRRAGHVGGEVRVQPGEHGGLLVLVVAVPRAAARDGMHEREDTDVAAGKPGGGQLRLCRTGR